MKSGRGSDGRRVIVMECPGIAGLEHIKWVISPAAASPVLCLSEIYPGRTHTSCRSPPFTVPRSRDGGGYIFL
jgi:hypothetical protein